MQKLFIIYLYVFVLLFLPIRASADEIPSFLFSEDDKIESTDLKSKIKNSETIINDTWFNSPPTRIELLTYIIDDYFSYCINNYGFFNDKSMDEYFEKGFRGYYSDVDSRFTFSKEKGCFVAHINIDRLGRPKKPMKEFCNYAIDMISSHIFALENRWFGPYKNNIFRPFVIRYGNKEKLSELINLLANNIIIVVNITSQYQNETDGRPRDYYSLYAIKNRKGEIYYSKSSFSTTKQE